MRVPFREIGSRFMLELVSGHESNPLSVYRPRQATRWWAHLVGALRVHPHKHCANFPPQKDRGCPRGERVPTRIRVCAFAVGKCTARPCPSVDRGRRIALHCGVSVSIRPFSAVALTTALPSTPALNPAGFASPRSTWRCTARTAMHLDAAIWCRSDRSTGG